MPKINGFLGTVVGMAKFHGEVFPGCISFMTHMQWLEVIVAQTQTPNSHQTVHYVCVCVCAMHRDLKTWSERRTTTKQRE